MGRVRGLVSRDRAFFSWFIDLFFLWEREGNLSYWIMWCYFRIVKRIFWKLLENNGINLFKNEPFFAFRDGKVVYFYPRCKCSLRSFGYSRDIFECHNFFVETSKAEMGWAVAHKSRWFLRFLCPCCETWSKIPLLQLLFHSIVYEQNTRRHISVFQHCIGCSLYSWRIHLSTYSLRKASEM